MRADAPAELPQRVISLCPSVTETLFALGAGALLVGRTRWCVEPRGEIERVPALGGTKNPDLQAVIAAAPDLVLMNEEENRREDAEALAARGIPLRAHFPRDVDGARAMVADLGEVLGCRSRSAELLLAIDEQRRAARASAAQRPRRKVAYLIWRRPWMGAGRDTYVAALLAEAGLDNALHESVERYPTCDLRELVSRGAEALLLSSEPFPFREKHRQEVIEESALPASRVLLVDGQALSWYGARTPEGLRTALHLAEKLGGLFPTVSGEE